MKGAEMSTPFAKHWTQSMPPFKPLRYRVPKNKKGGTHFEEHRLNKRFLFSSLIAG
jgi:hypothetical protein